jgi:uncharacterized protein (TIGR03083 family)
MDNTATWQLIHDERARLYDDVKGLTPEQWSSPSLCEGWTVLHATAHVVAGAQQTTGAFVRKFVSSGFRFDALIDRDLRRHHGRGVEGVLEGLRRSSSQTDKPPTPVVTMLGEIVVHGEDIRRPLAISCAVSPVALGACLDLYATMGFPLWSKKNVEGLTLQATDLDWTHGSGPMVSGPGMSLLLTMVGRRAGLDDLSGDGIAELRRRIS